MICSKCLPKSSSGKSRRNTTTCPSPSIRIRIRINKAYEILSPKRNDYDEYLRIKVSMDSPVENPVVVLFLLYLGIAGAVLFYQRQTQKRVKELILKNHDVIRYYWDKKGIDLTGKRKEKKSPRGRGRNRLSRLHCGTWLLR